MEHPMRRATTFSAAAVLAMALLAAGQRTVSAAAIGTAAPEINEANWLNSKPLTMAGLKGRVVALEFWTYG